MKKVERKRREGLRLISLTQPELDNEIKKQGRRKSKSGQRVHLEHQMREGIKLRDYNPDHVTDALGCRFVTLYQSEIPMVTGALLSTLSDFNQSHSDSPVTLREFVIYTNRPLQDPLSIVEATKDTLERSHFASTTSVIRDPENRKSAYSSVHLVFDRDVEIEHARRPLTTELAAFEIQIRDIFEEGWGEVQHHLLYSDRDDNDGETFPDEDTSAVATNWRLHLNALKTFVDGCSQHASIIRMHFDTSKKGPIPENVIRSAPERDKDRTAVVQTLRRLKASEAAQKAVTDGYVLFESGERAIPQDQKVALFLQACTRFEQGLSGLTARMRREAVPSGHGRTIEYYLMMEKGNCKVAAVEASRFSTTPDPKWELTQLTESRTLFESLAKKFASDPVVHARLAKALEKVSDDPAALAQSLEMYKKAASLVQEDPVTGPDHWLAILSHVNASYVVWLLSNLETDPEQVHCLLAEAADAALRGVNTWNSQSEVARSQYLNKLYTHKAASNVLYFGGRLMLCDKHLDVINERVIMESIGIIEDLAIDAYSDYYKTRDNLMHAYSALGNTEKARSLALQNFNELRAVAEARIGNRPLDVECVVDHLIGAEQRSYITAKTILLEGRLDAPEA